MFILLVILTIIIAYLHFNKNKVENFENSNALSNTIIFSKKNPFKGGGVLLNNNEGTIRNSVKLLSETSSISAAYSLYERNDKGVLLYVPDNYCQIAIESKDEKIHIFVSHLNTRYHYHIDRYVERSQQHNLIISLLLNNDDHKLYINNEKLYYYDYNLINTKSTKYSLTSEPIIINKDKKLKGILYGIITHNRIINIEEIKNVYNYIKHKFRIKETKQHPILKETAKPIKNNIRCNFDNKDICDNCPQTQIDLTNYKIIYENKECEDKITGYCGANKDYICDIINITNKLGNN